MKKAHDLEQLIGLSGIVEGKKVEVIEIILESNELILRELGQRKEQIDNQYGEPGQLGYKTYKIPIMSTVTNQFHPIIEELLKNKR